jgi:hypothetical protein
MGIFDDSIKAGLKVLDCPTCGAKTNEPCRTPKGRKKKDSIHDTRPFAIEDTPSIEH